ncbi:hypothetical protein LCI18_011585 [Fusarium solani-melongenae]|uniref:Uncharacterized protein n=1 Tax=Fusarium solani subsp. cucurbitae TaxID=2747967 RepID=A0ACD3ZHE4_FUSSC|nr:hypothetical protein LCI18_011585 [Fusarium solani-melongenae]
MESFSLLKRRTTDLLHNVSQNLPSMPMPSVPAVGSAPRRDAIKGTWERIEVPPVPRSSHSLDIIQGSAYIFGGEIEAREPVDNCMHVINLPWSGAGADYYKIKPVPAKPDDRPQQPEPEAPATTEAPAPAPAQPPAEAKKPEKETKESDDDSDDDSEEDSEEDSEDDSEDDSDDDSTEAGAEKPLDDVPLASPGLPAESKAKGKQPAGPEPLELGDVPAPRVGHATAVIGSRIFLFGGRGGPDMTPLDEAGRVWVFDTRSNNWSYLDPAPVVKGGSIIPHPAPRSYHTAAAIDRPRDFASPRPKQPETWSEWALGDTSKTGIPQDPIVGNVAEDAVDEESNGYGTFFVHAGCLANGERANDIWAFNVHDRTWSEFPAAPGPARGGTAICISKSRLFRFGGFDGETELGGQLDFLHLEVETFDDKGSKGEVSVRARGGWQTILQSDPNSETTEIHAEPSQVWPEPRSVASFEAITVGGGREYLVLAMGEREPSSEGHAGAGKFLDDVWMFQVPPLGMTAASVTAAMWQAVGRKTGEGKWSPVDLEPYDDDNSDELPESRGWIASAPMGDLEENGILIWGGVGEDGQRLGDGWILRVGE